MIRLLHLTDLHLTDGPRLADQAQVLDQVVTQAITNRVGLSILTGDLYGRVVPHRSTPAERAVLYPQVARLAAVGPVVVIQGNHDYPGDLDTLQQIGGGLGWPVIVVSRARVVKLQTAHCPVSVYAVPWPTKRNLLPDTRPPGGPEQLRQLASAKLDQLLGLWGARVARDRANDPHRVHLLASHCMTHGGRTSGGEVLTGHEIEISRKAMHQLGVDYGALGHLHHRQEPAPRCWYAGDPWAVDFGEVDPKGYHLVDVGPAGPILGVPVGMRVQHYRDNDGRHPATVNWILTEHRKWITLDWRWGLDHDSPADNPAACWIEQPDADQLYDVRGAEVRARLVVSQQWLASCPWQAVMQDLEDRGAHRIQVDRVVEPVHRVRAPEVAAAETLQSKLVAYWATLATTPDPADAAAATALLVDLQQNDDEQIAADTAALLAQD